MDQCLFDRYAAQWNTNTLYIAITFNKSDYKVYSTDIGVESARRTMHAYISQSGSALALENAGIRMEYWDNLEKTVEAVASHYHQQKTSDMKTSAPPRVVIFLDEVMKSTQHAPVNILHEFCSLMEVKSAHWTTVDVMTTTLVPDMVVGLQKTPSNRFVKLVSLPAITSVDKLFPGDADAARIARILGGVSVPAFWLKLFKCRCI